MWSHFRSGQYARLTHKFIVTEICRSGARGAPHDKELYQVVTSYLSTCCRWHGEKWPRYSVSLISWRLNAFAVLSIDKSIDNARSDTSCRDVEAERTFPYINNPE